MTLPQPSPGKSTATTIPPKAPSSLFRGYGSTKSSPFLSTVSDRHIVRDNFTISTWLLLGAVLQCVALALPIRSSYVVLPTLLLLGYRFVKGLLMCFGIIKHPYADGVVLGKTAPRFPESFDANGQQVTTGGGICVIILVARCNHPLGLFAPYYKDVADGMRGLISNLETRAPTNGFLGGTSYVNSSDRETGSEIMTLVYFRSHDDLQAFAHGEEHRKIWDWWNGLMKENRLGHIGLAHEVYISRKGDWEGIYLDMAPSIFAATQHWAVGENGQGSWQSPVVAAKGRYKSALGRLGKSKGEDNVAYGWDL